VIALLLENVKFPVADLLHFQATRTKRLNARHPIRLRHFTWVDLGHLGGAAAPRGRGQRPEQQHASPNLAQERSSAQLAVVGDA
jgi:hypothetical protein